MRITEKEQEIRKDRMLHSAHALFCEHGIDNVSLARIAKAAGVSPNSIFRYYNSKAQLVQSTQIILWEEITSHIMEDSEGQRAQARNGLEEIGILIYNFRKLYENHSKYLLFAYDYKLYMVRNHMQMTKEEHEATLHNVLQVFVDALERGQADGSISKSHTPMSQFFTIWGVMRSYVEEIIVYDRIFQGINPWKEYFPQVISQMLDGLKTGDREQDEEKGR